MEEPSAGTAPNPNDIQTGNRIRRRRRALGISLWELSEIVGVSTKQLRRYESGKQPLTAFSLARISHVLGISIGHSSARAPKSRPIVSVDRFTRNDAVYPEIETILQLARAAASGDAQTRKVLFEHRVFQGVLRH
jgi:transcriptional regulator with XRE-family HTH domain